MVRDADARRSTRAHADPCEALPVPPAPEGTTASAVEALESGIAMQEQVVAMLRERKAARERVLHQVRAVLEAGRAAEATALDTEADALREGQASETGTDTAPDAPTSTAVNAPHTAETVAARSASPKEADEEPATDLTGTEADLANLLSRVAASLARAEAMLALEPHTTVDTDGIDSSTPHQASGEAGPTMEDLLGVTEEQEDALTLAKARKAKKKNRRRRRGLPYSAADCDPASAPTLSKRDQAERRALFDAVDAVASTLPLRTPAPSDSTTAHGAEGSPTSVPAWLLEEDEDEASATITEARETPLAPDDAINDATTGRADRSDAPHETGKDDDEEPHYSDDFEDDEDTAEVQ